MLELAYGALVWAVSCTAVFQNHTLHRESTCYRIKAMLILMTVMLPNEEYSSQPKTPTP